MTELSRQEHYELLMKNDMKNLYSSKSSADFERVVLSCVVRWYSIEEEFSSRSILLHRAKENLREAAFMLKSNNWQTSY